MQPNDESSSHVEWSHPVEGWRKRIKWRFVLMSWLLSVVVTIVVALPIGWVWIATQDVVEVVDAEGMMIVAGFTTFIAFFIVMFARLRRIDHDRLLNSMTVAAFHVLASLILILLTVILRASLDGDTIVPGDRFEQMALIGVSLERTAAAALVACGLAAAVMPARGPVPSGMQTADLPTDRQL